MISYVKGTVEEIFENMIVVENNNIGYNIRVPATVINGISGKGCEVKIYTYLYVREDAINLFGFLTTDALELFKLLLNVSGIGPRGALQILSTISPNDLRFAILSGDAKAIQKAPGIGAKTAQKLIIELKDKLKLEDAFEERIENNTVALKNDNARNEAIEALIALGYSNTDAFKAVNAVGASEGMDVESLLKQALKKMSL